MVTILINAGTFANKEFEFVLHHVTVILTIKKLMAIWLPVTINSMQFLNLRMITNF